MSCKKKPHFLHIGSNGQNGIVLLVVLWIIAVLSVIVLEFCFGMRTEVNLTNQYKEELQLYEMAKGGVYRAILELIYRQDPRIHQKRKTLESEELKPEEKEWVTDGRSYTIPFSQGRCEVKVMGEDGKVNINHVSESLLRKIIGNLGLEGEARDIVVDSILDWRDPDDFYRLNGAETDYYRSLPEPYECKNGPLDSLEELLLVRGVTPQLFDGIMEKEGREERIGLKNIFSIYASGEQIDINSASPLVMRVVLGVSKEMAQLISKSREERPFENQMDLLRRVPELTPLMGEIGKYITYGTRSPYFTIESKARGSEGKSVRGLKVLVKIDLREKDKYKIIQWVDSIF